MRKKSSRGGKQQGRLHDALLDPPIDFLVAAGEVDSPFRINAADLCASLRI